MSDNEEIPIYKYWEPVYSQEHYLLLREITELWNLYSPARKPMRRHTLLTTKLLKKYCEINNLRTFYYETRNGLKQVYPRSVYVGAYEWFLEKTDCKKSGVINLDGVNYTYQVGNE